MAVVGGRNPHAGLHTGSRAIARGHLAPPAGLRFQRPFRRRAKREPALTSRRILVVDDRLDAAQSFAFLLAELGQQAEFITDPYATMENARRLRPELVFLDIGMPGLDGWQLSRLLRAEFGFDAIRIVAVTAYGELADRKRSREAGFDAHVVKPVSVELVQSILDTIFEPKRL
jgi:CheY-like chemotaxis protein